MVSGFLHLSHKPVSCTPILFKYAFSPHIASRNLDYIVSLRRDLYIVLVLCFTDSCNSLYSFLWIHLSHSSCHFFWIYSSTLAYVKLREARIWCHSMFGSIVALPANWSARSLPEIPMWLGTRRKAMHLVLLVIPTMPTPSLTHITAPNITINLAAVYTSWSDQTTLTRSHAV